MIPELRVSVAPTRSGVKDRVLVEAGREPIFRQLGSVAGNPREANFQRIAVGPDGLDLDGLARRLRRRHHGFGVEVERDAEHVGVLDVEEVLVVQVIRLPAERAADHLLAQQLRAEGAHPENVGHGVGVPSLGEHRDGDHTADVSAQAAGLADGVHHLAQKVLVSEVVGLAGVTGALNDLAPEAVDLVGGHGAEVVVERFAGFQLFAVDQQRSGASEWVAVLVMVLEQRQAAELELAGTVVVLALKTGDVVVDEFRRRGVVAYDDEAGRHRDLCLRPKAKGLLVVAVQRIQRCLQLRRQVERVECFGLATALLRHLGADVFPQVAEHRHLVAGNIVCNGYARQLDDAALDGVHQ